MYIFFPVLLFFMILFSLFLYFRHKVILRKICSQSLLEKVQRLNHLLAPFGFEYDLSQDIFTSRLDAWQREYGYQYLYDLGAPHFNMVIDCEPVYFDYDGCTWLLEIWKGQYGINIGAEIGLYKADRLLGENELKTAHFQAVSDTELPTFSIKLYDHISLLYTIRKRHWWLTGFVMGEFATPEKLYMKIQIDFPTCQMCCAFLGGLRNLGYDKQIFKISASSVCFDYMTPSSMQPRSLQPLTTSFAQWKNRIFLRMYHWATRPFCHTIDKLLYLYEFIPYVFRHTMTFVYRGKYHRRKKG